MKRNAFTLFGALALAALALGCSATAMKAAPIWDREYHKAAGPAENRVNLWPIYYYRDPAWAVLWPLVSVTDEGSAVVPLYEYDKTRDTLRLLSVHQYLPTGATLAPGYTRVLNTVRDKRGTTDQLNILPIYFQDFKDQELLVLPLLYKDRTGFWTPLVTKTKKLAGVLGPLFNRFKAGNTTYYHFPFPLVGVKTGTDTRSFWAFPAIHYGYTGKATHLNIGGLLLDVDKDEKHWKTTYAALLGGAGRKENGDAHNRLIPLWAWWRKGGKEGLLSLPYSHYKNGDYELTDALLNGWIEVRDGEKLYQGALWPVFHRFRDAGKTGNAVLPVYWYERERGGAVTFHSLPFNYRSDGTLLNVLGPLYYHQVSAGGDRYTTVAWPLAQAWDGADGSKATALLPLYYEKRDAAGERMLATPLGGMSKKGDEEILDLAGPLFFGKRNTATGKSYHAVAWPLAHRWQEKGETALLLLPAFYTRWARDEYDFASLPLSFGGFKTGNKSHYLNVGVLLFHRKASENSTQGFMLANLIGWGRDRKQSETEAHFFPLFSYAETPDYEKFSALLSGYYNSKKDEQTLGYELRDPELNKKNIGYPTRRLLHERHMLAFLFRSATYLRRDIEPLTPGASLAVNEIEVDAPGRGRMKAAVRRETTTTLLPLLWYGKTVEGEGSEAYLGWRIYDAMSEERPDGKHYERQRVLWRVFHRERLDDVVAVDMFPFISWDANPQTGTRRFTFAGGLLGGGTKDGKGYAQVLFMKF